MTDDASELGKAEEDARREQGKEAFFSGRYREAYSHSHSALLSKAIRWFREEGVAFHRPPAEFTPTELIVGLGLAAHKEIAARGENASHKLQVAASLFAVIAELRMALDEPTPPDDVDAMHEKLAELVIRAAQVGQVEMMMVGTEIGWFDKLNELEKDREGRRMGAVVVNARKASAREQALGEAISIVGGNPTLTNEDVAKFVLKRTTLPTTIRTATDWVRLWRKEGFLPARKTPDR